MSRSVRRPGRSAAALLLLILAAACVSPAGAPDELTPLRTSAPTVAPATAGATAAHVPSATPGLSPTTPGVDPPTATPNTAPPGDSITISAVGDISLARQLVERMEAEGTDYPYALVAPLIDGDVGFANLEGALTERGDPWPKGYNFRTPPRFTSGLRRAGFDVVTLGNNHTMDFGEVGLIDTIEALDTAGILHTGAGVNGLAAHIPVIFEANGLRVAFLGYAATPTESGGFSIQAWAAGDATPGLALGTPERLVADVQAAKTIADFVIVAVHAGSEYITTPNDTQQSLARAALAAGADAYIGAHAHVVQPVEQRGQQLIAWGLGNFIFDLDNVDLANIPTPRVSLILNITLTKGVGVSSYRAIPVTQDEDQDRPRPATPDEAAILRALIGSGGAQNSP